MTDDLVIGEKGEPGDRGLPGIDVSWPISYFIRLSICGGSVVRLVCLHVVSRV